MDRRQTKERLRKVRKIESFLYDFLLHTKNGLALRDFFGHLHA